MGSRQVIDSRNLHIRILKYLSEGEPADSSKSVNCNFNHILFTSRIIYFVLFIAACAAASLAIGTLSGEQDT